MMQLNIILPLPSTFTFRETTNCQTDRIEINALPNPPLPGVIPTDTGTQLQLASARLYLINRVPSIIVGVISAKIQQSAGSVAGNLQFDPSPIYTFRLWAGQWLCTKDGDLINGRIAAVEALA